MMIQVMIIRDSNHTTLNSPSWEVTTENYDTVQPLIEQYLKDNQGHYAMPILTWKVIT